MDKETKFINDTYGAPSDCRYHAMRDRNGYINYYVLTKEVEDMKASGWEYLGPSNSIRAAQKEGIKV